MALTVLRAGQKLLRTHHFYSGNNTCFLHSINGKTNVKSNTRDKMPRKNPNKPGPTVPPPPPSQSKASADTQLDNFVSRWLTLIERRNQTILEDTRIGIYRQFTEEWAESFYHIKGKHTRAACLSLDQIPIVLAKIFNPDCRRDFLLYKDIPTMVVISDFHQNFGRKELPEIDNLEYNPFPLTADATLPAEYRSVLVDEGESPPKGFHVILNSNFVRIFSHVTQKELFQSWILDQLEREKQVRTIYRRNKWPFTEKVE